MTVYYLEVAQLWLLGSAEAKERPKKNDYLDVYTGPKDARFLFEIP